MEKKLSEITRKEWALYHWIDVVEFGPERLFEKGPDRTPDEAIKALNHFDMWKEIKNSEEEPINNGGNKNVS